MKTAIICIGNSDDKLRQSKWASFNRDLRELAYHHSVKVQFNGNSAGEAKWQNACWVINIDAERVGDLRGDLAFLAEQYGQDSIALVIGETEIIARQPRPESVSS